jgi:aminoglycoside N3'-acetyltransferase
MSPILKKLAQPILGKTPSQTIRLAKWKLRKKFYTTPVLISEIRDSLLALGEWRGRTVWVQSSWNEFYNVNAKPSELIEMMRDLVGPAGNLVMPAFPIDQNPDKMLKIDSVPSSTGLLTEIFRRQPDACRSIHLRSSVAAIGPDAAEICARHHLTPYPWGAGSPYHYLYDVDALLVGVGFVPMGFTPLHMVECELHARGRAGPSCFDGTVTYRWLKNNGETGEHCFHNRVGRINPGRIVKYYDKACYRSFHISNIAFMGMPAREGVDRAFALAEKGITIYPDLKMPQIREMLKVKNK